MCSRIRSIHSSIEQLMETRVGFAGPRGYGRKARRSPLGNALTVGQVEREDRPPDLLELQLAVIGSAHPDPGAVDDRLCQRAEPGPPVDAALQHDIALLHRVDAKAEQTVQIGRLDMLR